MPMTDHRQQGIPYPLLTDAANAQTLGQGIVNAVVDRIVMRFNSASHRGSVITTPQPGMVTWIEDQRILQVYDGLAWVTIATAGAEWTNLPLASGYTLRSSNPTLGVPQYKLLNIGGTRFVALRGGFSITYDGTSLPNSGRPISQPLPEIMRPTVERRVNATCSDLSSTRGALKLELSPDGWLSLSQPGGSTPGWVSLDGILYSL